MFSPQAQLCPLTSLLPIDAKAEPLNETRLRSDLLHPGQLQLFIRVDEKSIALVISPKSKVLELKEKLERDLGIPVNDQRLLFGGAWLVDDRHLSEYGLKSENTISLSECSTLTHASAHR